MPHEYATKLRILHDFILAYDGVLYRNPLKFSLLNVTPSISHNVCVSPNPHWLKAACCRVASPLSQCRVVPRSLPNGVGKRSGHQGAVRLRSGRYVVRRCTCPLRATFKIFPVSRHEGVSRIAGLDSRRLSRLIHVTSIAARMDLQNCWIGFA